VYAGISENACGPAPARETTKGRGGKVIEKKIY